MVSCHKFPTTNHHGMHSDDSQMFIQLLQLGKWFNIYSGESTHSESQRELRNKYKFIVRF